MRDRRGEEELNPWWTIWVYPRLTIRQVIDTNPRMHFWVLALFFGIVWTAVMGTQVGLGDYFPPAGVAGFILFFGTLFGIGGVYVLSALLGRLARPLGGKAEGQHIRAVLVWAGMPMCVLLALGLFPFILMFGQRTFSTADPVMHRIVFYRGGLAGFLDGGLLIWKMLMDATAALYFIFISVVGFAEVQKISILKSIGILFMVLGGLLLASLILVMVGQLL
jgi:hypothetical protein